MSNFHDMTKPAGESESFELTFFDGRTRKVYITDDQFRLPATMMIFSRTDKNGIITHVNVPFIEASGWEKEELIGQPHYILRHPHMPSSAFEDMWNTLQAGEQWTGCVKNLRKDGGYYWVRAVSAQSLKTIRLSVTTPFVGELTMRLSRNMKLCTNRCAVQKCN